MQLTPCDTFVRRWAPRTLAVMAMLSVVLTPARASAASFVVTNLNAGGAGSLRAAIESANANAGPDEITFAPGLTGTIPLGGNQLAINESLTVSGPGSQLLTIDAGGASRVMSTFTPGVSLTLSGLSLRGGNTAGPGGGLAFIDGDDLLLSDVRFVDNESAMNGGGLAFESVNGLVELQDTWFTDNSTDDEGGAIYGHSGTIGNIHIDRTTITGNTAVGNVGGILVIAGDRAVVLRDVVIDDNSTAGGDFGGGYVVGTYVQIDRTSITANSSIGGVGGFHATSIDANLNVADLTVTGNRATGGDGGARFHAGSFVNLTRATIENNIGLNLGGAAATAVDTVRIRDSRIAGNTSAGANGGVVVDAGNALRVERSTIANNTASTFPGLNINNAPMVLVDSSTVSGNTATGGSDGAGIYMSGPVGAARIINSTISGNTTTGDGGGVYTHGLNLAIVHSTVSANNAGNGGGVARGGAESVTLGHTIVSGNKASTGPDLSVAATATYSLIGDTAGATIVGGNNLIGADPELGELSLNGGPTATHLPAPTSPVIDAGHGAIAMPPDTDQRGFDRVNGTVDIGAVETFATDYPVADGAAAFVGVEPSRIYDSRPGLLPSTGPKGIVGPNGSVDVAVLGEGGVPTTGVSAVVVNVTATDVAGPSFVSAIPTPSGAGSDPTVSSVNTPRAGLTRSNLAVVPVGDGGRIRLFSKEAAHVIVDVFGYYELTDVMVSDGRMIPVAPHRAFDTRPDEPAAGPKGLVGAGDTIAPQILGVGPVPASGVAAVVINVTTTLVDGPSFVTVWPSGPMSDTSSLNISEAGETAANTVIVPVGDDGRIRLFTLRSAHLIGDVVGYVTDESAPVDETGLFVATTPRRLFDTRDGELPTGAPKGKLLGMDTITVDMPGRAGLPSGLGMVLMNVTATDAATGFITVYPHATQRPLASTVNPNPDGDTRANTTFAGLGSNGAISFFSLNAAHLLADTAGYTLP